MPCGIAGAIPPRLRGNWGRNVGSPARRPGFSVYTAAFVPRRFLEVYSPSTNPIPQPVPVCVEIVTPVSTTISSVAS